eukprot:snap_masked-scaffold_9-processed-gene-12.34-mRNA-1 protein AED:0.35 eAED:0.35 QI:0/0/0/1/1/1/2/0/332
MKTIIIEVGSKNTKTSLENQKSPIKTFQTKRGLVINWEALENVWKHAFFNEIQVKPEEVKVLLIEPPLNPYKTREKATKIMFETFGVQGLTFQLNAALSLIHSGRETGVVVDSGAEVTNIVPIYLGFPLLHAVQNLNLGGNDLDELFFRYLRARNFEHVNMPSLEEIETLKIEACVVANSWLNGFLEKDIIPFQKDFTLSSGFSCTLGVERLQVPEALFDPTLLGTKAMGIHNQVFSAVKKCEADIHIELYNSIVVSGGNTLFENFEVRLKKEIEQLDYSGGTTVDVIALTERVSSAIFGAKIIAAQDVFLNSVISRTEYEQIGPDIHKKCL